jgi:ferredoxin
VSNVPIDRTLFQELLQKKVAEVSLEPEYGWRRDFGSYMTDTQGAPVVRVGVVNFDPRFDIWQRLRNPAQAGVHPLTPADIWDYYAANDFQRTRPDGTANALATPESFPQALDRIGRVIIVSAMLVVNPEVYERYAVKIEQGDLDSFDYYARATGEVAEIIDKAVGKFALSLMAPGRAVVPMTTRNSQRIVDRTRSLYRTGPYHGPCNNHWPQNSIAVLTGLMRFGVHRLAFRDEVDDRGQRQRFYGRYRSIVIFDQHPPVSEGPDGVTRLDAERLDWLRRLNDYTDVSPEVVEQRYCTYNVTQANGRSVCGKCLDACPPKALPNSSPRPDGVYSVEIRKQTHRFWDTVLDFDYSNCTNDRHQKVELFEEYVCARCEVMCAARGVRKPAANVRRINA